MGEESCSMVRRLTVSLAIAVGLSGCELLLHFENPPEQGPQCADGLDNDDNGPADCADPSCADEANCLCGNGVLDPGEACDDGNRNDNDSCSTTCQLRCS